MFWNAPPAERAWVDHAFDKLIDHTRRVVLRSPFTSAEVYARLLGDELSSAHRIETPWRDVQGLDATSTLLVACERWSRRAEKPLLLQLAPQRIVGDVSTFGAWFRHVVHLATRTNVRFLGFRESAAWMRYVEPGHVRVHSSSVGVRRAIEELAFSVERGTDEGRVRTELLRCMHRAGDGDAVSAQGHARAAIELACRIGRPDLGVAACFALGSMHLGAARLQLAIESYVEAERLAYQATKSGISAGAMLAVYARMGAGSVLMTGGAFELAGRHFTETIAFAVSASDVRLEIESSRLALEAYARAKRWNDAWESGWNGTMSWVRTSPSNRPMEAVRAHSQAMYRITATPALTRFRKGLVAQLDAHAGAAWRELR